MRWQALDECDGEAMCPAAITIRPWRKTRKICRFNGCDIEIFRSTRAYLVHRLIKLIDHR